MLRQSSLLKVITTFTTVIWMAGSPPLAKADICAVLLGTAPGQFIYLAGANPSGASVDGLDHWLTAELEPALDRQSGRVITTHRSPLGQSLLAPNLATWLGEKNRPYVLLRGGAGSALHRRAFRFDYSLTNVPGMNRFLESKGITSMLEIFESPALSDEFLRELPNEVTIMIDFDATAYGFKDVQGQYPGRGLRLSLGMRLAQMLGAPVDFGELPVSAAVVRHIAHFAVSRHPPGNSMYPKDTKVLWLMPQAAFKRLERLYLARNTIPGEAKPVLSEAFAILQEPAELPTQD